MNNRRAVCIQEGVPFSQSMLWQVQREYYDSSGIEAWSEQVPFYVTSNLVIADQYARLLMGFFHDWVERHPDTRNQPFYILELGTGTGQFSYYVVKRLLELQQASGLEPVSFRYVMSDFTMNNLDFWRQHPSLQPYIQAGLIDFAIFDLEKDQNISLQLSEEDLVPGSLSTPITVIANYLFDSIVMDVFRIKDNQIQESLVDISIDNQHVNNGQTDWPKACLNYSDQAVAVNYYQHDVFDKILQNYTDRLKDTHLQFPIGGLRGLENLAAIANDQLLLLTSDKGYVDISELEALEPPELAFHGSFSTMVNYHAIAEYFRHKGGDVCLQEQFDAFATGAFALGFKFNELPIIRNTLRDTVRSFSPGHYFHLYDHFENTIEKASLETIASMLTYSHWDPSVFDLASDRVSDLLEDSDEDVVNYLSRHLPELADHFYFVPGVNDTFFDVGVYYQELEEYEQAIKYFTQSAVFYPDCYEVYFNLGYCYFELKRFVSALEYFEKAREFQPKSKELLKYIRQVSKKIQA